jgi:hypothetical protein
VGEDIAFGMEFGRLFDADHGIDLGQDFLEQAGVAQELEGLAGLLRFGQQAEQFVADAFGADAADLRGELLDGGERGGSMAKPRVRSEADGAQHAQVVLGEADGGIADGADEVRVEIGAAADEIADFAGGRIEEEGVDGEIAAEGVFAGVGEGDGFGAAAVGIGGIGAIGGDFDGNAVIGHDDDDAEGLAEGDRLGKERFDAVGERVGGDVPVLGLAAEQEIADAAADEPRLVAVFAQGAQDVQGGGWNGRVQSFMSA